MLMKVIHSLSILLIPKHNCHKGVISEKKDCVLKA